MQKKNLFIFLLFFPAMFFAQDYSALWKGHFSYYNIKDIVKGNNKIYAASENAVFSLDTRTNEIQEISTINGLSGEKISTIYYSETYKLLMIGYETGLIEIVFDNDKNVLKIFDIVDKATIPYANKRINHFNPFKELVYISTNYGISVFNLELLEFGDTYFIGNGGNQIIVKQTAIYNNSIYAACYDNGGIKMALLSNSNLIDYRNWQNFTEGEFKAVENIKSKLYVISHDNKIYSIENGFLELLFSYDENVVKMTSYNESLIVLSTYHAHIYDKNFNLTTYASVQPDFNTPFNTVTIDSDFIYIGTEIFGVLKSQIINPNEFEEVHPKGPLLNRPFSILAHKGDLWVTFGDYTNEYDPYPLDSYGFSRLSGNEWVNTQFKDVLGAKCLNGISISPTKINVNGKLVEKAFISSFFSGILELHDGVPFKLHNDTNGGGLESLITTDPNYKDIRVGSSAFDNKGVLWTISSLVKHPLKSYNLGENKWNVYDFDSIGASGSNCVGFNEIVIDPITNTKFITSYSKGVVGFNENKGNIQLKVISKLNGNLPADQVRSLAIDRNNQLWIGTHYGLRVLYNTANFFTTNNLKAEQIIILEDGEAKELLESQFISDIKVDGSNNKWIATAGSGVFYLSADGQKTFFHFTTENSPLPSNNVSDISIDEINGIVYIATDKGLVSYRAAGTIPFENLKSAFVFPNPVRPNYDIVSSKVKIRAVSEHVNIKITDIEGNLVAEAQSKVNQRHSGYYLEMDGGTAFWNGKNLSNDVVSSGVYLVMITDLDTSETTVLKLMVVR